MIIQNNRLVVGYARDGEQVTQSLPDLRPCGKCGATAHWESEIDDVLICCDNRECLSWISSDTLSPDDLAKVWNDRPVEDTLLTLVVTLTAEITALKDQRTYWIDQRLRLERRIAELEIQLGAR